MLHKIFFILLIGSNFLNAQSSTGYVEYDYSVIHVVNYTTKSVLKFDSEKSVFRTFRNESMNDTTLTLIPSKGSDRSYLMRNDSGKKPIYFLDKKKNMLISKIWSFKKNYLLTEDIPKIPWKIKQEFKTLDGLHCQKAEGYFRGRTYVVWFTPDIPINLGPWKLQGLPGLIVDAQDSQGIFFYRATKIKLNADVTLDIPTFDKAVSLKTFITEIKPKKMEEINSRLNAQLDRSITIESSVIDRSSLKEMQYEWEDN
ncbi:GLPGLI family protein [Spongiivirga citrea]|uniref:GLPGLI family protein n=1 Tax=Spongiivirga citrea TaxID=1481457 RepID=A0A6M0CI60_9FLAO|nr:GLPGLI family protein [Spongiivirga citrea]NER17212.1 GLPGLI family protein [Spongiivirga citrea]